MPDAVTVQIRPAATVVLLRDGADGLEVWLQQRASTLAFAAGMYAFPGGAVDAIDYDLLVPDKTALHHASVWGDQDSATASAHVAAAVRETYEESGVQLDPSTLVPWARWMTPIGQSRRFDARFYLARCPKGQEPQPLTGEVAAGDWFVLRRAVEAHAAGALPMWPPTISTLLELVPFDHVGAAIDGAPPRIEVTAG
jgi:8-oxo-dGTP pyrophosphatase MutT (NUDIX family)